MAKKTKKVSQRRSFRFLIKMSLCLIYFVVAFILAYCAFQIYTETIHPVAWKNVESTKDYTYIDIDKMSEKFATIDGEKNIHFIIDEEKNGVWHIYLLAIKEEDYSKYKDIIDYTYERTTKKPKTIRVYGYPSAISNELKELTIKNYKSFVSFENEIELTFENFNEYLTNAYFDSTKEKVHDFNWIVFVLMLLDVVLFILIIFTILDKDKLVDEVDRLIEMEELKKNK